MTSALCPGEIKIYLRFCRPVIHFKPDYITTKSCVVIQIRKAWTLMVNPRFPFDESESIFIAEVLVQKHSHKNKNELTGSLS